MRISFSLAQCALCLFLYTSLFQLTLAQPAETSEDTTEQIADWLPETTVIFGKISPVSQWLEHPLREGVVQNEAFKKLWRSPQALQLRSGMTVAELALGLKLDQLAKDLTEQGAYLAVDSQTNGVAMLLRTQSKEWLDDYVDKALEFIKKDAKSKGNTAPIEQAEYRGIQGYKIQNGIFATFGPWLLVTNQGDLAKSILDRKLDQGKGLSNTPWFQEMQRNSKDAATKTPTADFWIDLKSLRERMKNNSLFQDQARDFGAELILGGVLSVLANAQVLQASLQMDSQGASPRVSNSFRSKVVRPSQRALRRTRRRWTCTKLASNPRLYRHPRDLSRCRPNVAQSR